MKRDDPELQAFLEMQLAPGERVLWTGRASRGGAWHALLRQVRRSTTRREACIFLAFLIWVAALWLAFARLRPMLAFYPLTIGLGFLCQVCDAYRRERRHLYALTDRRALVLSLDEAPFARVCPTEGAAVTCIERPDRSGDLQIEQDTPGAEGDTQREAVTFFGIPHIGDVRRLAAGVLRPGEGESPIRAPADAAQALRRLIQCLSSRRHGWRSMAEDALVDLGPAAVGALVQALRDVDRRVRAAAARCLGHIAERHPAEQWVVEALLRATEDGCREVRDAAWEALQEAGKAAALPMIRAEWTPEGWHDGILAAAGFLGDPAFSEAVLEALTGEDRSGVGRLQAAFALGEDLRRRVVRVWGDLGTGAQNRLLRLVAEGPDWAGVMAAEALAESDDAEVRRQLLTLLDAGRSHARLRAAITLGFLGDARAVTVLAAAVRDPDRWVRSAVGRSLAHLGAAGSSALPALEAALPDEKDAAARSIYREAIQQIRLAARRGPLELLSAHAPRGRGTEPESSAQPGGRGTEPVADVPAGRREPPGPTR